MKLKMPINQKIYLSHILLNLLLEKGHKYQHLDVKLNKNAYNKETIMKDSIFEASNITSDMFNDMLERQQYNRATRDDKLAIEKYMFKKHWKIDDVTEVTKEFLDKYYGKDEMLTNLRCLLKPHKINVYIEDDNLKQVAQYSIVVVKEKIDMIRKVIETLGFDKPGDGVMIDKDTFVANIEKVKTECHLFINPNKSQPMFEYDKMKIRSIGNVKQFLGFVNSLLMNYGIVIKSIPSFVRTKVNNKWKTTRS